MIEGRNITKRFGDRVIFSDLNFTIEDGEFVCFSGESGIGKTTLLNIIGLLEPIDEGTILFDGKEIIARKDKSEFYRNYVGFLFQNYALIEHKSVKENLKLIKNESLVTTKFEQILEEIGLYEVLNRKVYTLSGGEQQRVALARLYLKKCNLILADEPTGSLDCHNADIVMRILKDLNRKGKTIILVTHDLRIKEMAGRIIEL